MNSDIVEGKWKQMTGDVKKFFGKLTDDDMTQIEGDRDKMVGKLQERYGYTRDQAEAEWNKFTNQSGDSGDKAHAMKNDVDDAAHDAKNALKDATTDVKNAVKR